MEYCGGGSLQDIYHGKLVVCFENIHSPFFIFYPVTAKYVCVRVHDQLQVRSLKFRSPICAERRYR